MSKIQIEKDFKELYPTGNAEERVREYYRKKRKEMILLSFAAGFLLLVSLYSELHSKKPKDNILTRNKYGGGKKEISLEVKIGDGNWVPFSFVLEEKEYTRQELNELYEEAVTSLPQVIKKDNENLQSVTSDLELVASLDNYPFSLIWSSSSPQILDEDGVIYFENITKKEEIVLSVILQYQDWEKASEITVTVLPKSSEDYLYFISKNIMEEEKNTRKDIYFGLPGSYNNQILNWKYPGNNTTLFLALLFLVILPFLSYQKDKEVHRRLKVRREKLQDAFPDFISRLVLFMEAGMSVRSTLFRILQDEQKKQNYDYLYEELAFICRQMKNGLAEKEAYELLAIRCNLSCYRKLSGLLLQYMQKGSNTILDNLRKEAVKAGEEKKARIQKRGEEMGTKLLFPMMIMLGIVMVFIMVPALFSFRM